MAMELVYKTVGAIIAPFRYAQREIENTKESLEADAKKAAFYVLKISIMVFSCLFFLLFGCIALAIVLNENMNSPWSGFVIVAGSFFLIAMGIFAWIKS